MAHRRLDREPDAYRAHELEDQLVFLGLAAMKDPLRPEAKAAVQACHDAGIQTVMITGDHKDTAVAIAEELRALKGPMQSLSGMELDRLSDDELVQRVDEVSVYARVSAEHKLRIVKAWKARGAIVAMTGDGVNDAPAIKAADIGVAMGITGTDVTKEAADMVVTDDNFASIAAAVEEGRADLRQHPQDHPFSLVVQFQRGAGDVVCHVDRSSVSPVADSNSVDESGDGRISGLGAGSRSQVAGSDEAAASPAGCPVVGRRHTPGHRGARGHVERDRVGSIRL